ncbi:hypothetical protein [Alkaliphilus oremlandii]|nr:hypothetical protein [Alkaliphilus oremlandii]
MYYLRPALQVKEVDQPRIRLQSVEIYSIVLKNLCSIQDFLHKDPVA